MPASNRPPPHAPGAVVRTTGRTRSRGWLGWLLVLIVGAGLASRTWPHLLPAWCGKYPGDVLWAAMILTGLALLRPGLDPLRLAGLSLAICTLVEVSQLCQAPWLNALRATGWGHLVLGTTFHWPDLAAYAAGIVVSHAVDRARWSRRVT